MTAVEFIVEQLAKNGVLHSSDIAKAKEMQKEQIKDAYINGRYEADKIVMGHNFYAEQYYNETFKSE